MGTMIGFTAADLTTTIVYNSLTKPTLENVSNIAQKTNYTINDYFLQDNKSPEVVLIGDIHGEVDKNLEIILEELVSNGDVILIESPTELTNINSVIDRSYLHNLLINSKLKNISINGSDDKKLVILSLEALAFRDFSYLMGDTLCANLATDSFFRLAYKRDHNSFYPKIKKSVERNRVKNNNYKKKINLESSSETYQVIGSLHLEMDEIRKNLRKSDITYISIIPNRAIPEELKNAHSILMEKVKNTYDKANKSR